MARVRLEAAWTDGSVVAKEEFSALDEGQHKAIKWGDGDIYNITTDPITITGKGMKILGDGLGLGQEGPYYAAGIGGVPLTLEFALDPAWFIPAASVSSNVWSGDVMGMAQILNTADVYAACVLNMMRFHKQKLRRLRLRVKGTATHTDGNIGTMKKPQFFLQVQDHQGATVEDIFPPVPLLTAYADASSTATGYHSLHYIDTGVNALDVEIDKTQYSYVLFIEGESGTGSKPVPNLTFLSVLATFDISTMPFG